MTVKQLIEHLQTLPQDLPVYLVDWNEGYMPDIPIDYVGQGYDGQQQLPQVAEPEKTRWGDLPRRVVIG